ncbi:hypothetical protein HPB52_001677 [Rhipicephalus sanguineus]|uniref:Carboxylesterase type B domain-containing protein n=1 Tax=Rhipicephalus sanguineus TaxID=34632 RepID=A0A9D4PTT9_RHISA|nr:hypothetical protein HPB52_001677 [Rhipicephalus sanguineus]
MEVTDSSKGDDRAATREPHVRTLRVHSDRTATGSGTASSRLGHRRGSRIGSPAVRADSLATREAQAHRDDAQEPLERAEKVCQLTYAGLFALFLTLFAYFLVNALSTGTIVRVRTEMGLVSGELRRVMENNVFHYLGLPYASKPARFQRAGPADRLRLNHIVPQFPGVRCMQVVENGSNTTWPKSQLYGEVSKPWYSEDCLYLNIWSPVPPCDYTSDVCHASASVVVVLFSVGFGQGGADWYNGALLSSLGGVVIVAPNFRLGPLAVPLKG